MTITVKDETGKVEVNLGHSEAQPGATNVTIFGFDEFEVQQVIADLSVEYTNAVFTAPTKCSDHRWGAMGRVW